MLTALVFALAIQTPNDPIFPSQWGLQLIGVPAAWEITTGSTLVPLVDIDAGVQLDHPDLGNLNQSSDLWDTCDQHGTLMAGTIAATADNGQGIAGILWQSNLIVYNGGSTRGSIATSIDRARTDTSAKIVLIEKEILPLARQQPLKSALDALWNDGHRLAIVPSGNVWGGGVRLGGRNDPHILVVAACNLDGTQAFYSNYGAQVDLWAPGHATSTAPPADYGAGDGTSQSAAYVLGVAGLVLAANPALTGEEVQAILISTATPMACGPVVNALAAVEAATP